MADFIHQKSMSFSLVQRSSMQYHNSIMFNKYPHSISRLSMTDLKSAHTPAITTKI